MSKLLSSIAMCAIAIALVSCEKEEIKQTEEKGPKLFVKQIESKISYTDEGSVSIKWKVKDAITAFNKTDGTSVGHFICTEVNANTKVATFQAQGNFPLVNNAEYTFIYPYSNAANLSEINIPYDNLIQNGNGNMAHCEHINYMQSPDYKYTTEKTQFVTFDQKMAMLTLELPKPLGYEELTNGAPNYIVIDFGADKKRIDLMLQNVSDWNTPLKIYSLIPPQVKPSLIKIRIYSSKGITHFEHDYTPKEGSFEAGKRYFFRVPENTIWKSLRSFSLADFATGTALTSDSIPNLLILNDELDNKTIKPLYTRLLTTLRGITDREITLILPNTKNMEITGNTSVNCVTKIVFLQSTSFTSGMNAFPNVKELLFPLLTTLPSDAFSGLSIESLYLPNVKSIGDYAIAFCYNLKSVVIATQSGKLDEFGDGVFEDTNTAEISLTIGNQETATNTVWRGYNFKNIMITW